MSLSPDELESARYRIAEAKRCAAENNTAAKIRSALLGQILTELRNAAEDGGLEIEIPIVSEPHPEVGGFYRARVGAIHALTRDLGGLLEISVRQGNVAVKVR